ncbi:hypothetical protein Tco_1363931 [Tanacetum coccineum]
MDRITIKEYEIEFEVFDLLKIDLDLFTYDTPLGTIFDEFKRLSSMKDDLFVYELGVLTDFYFPCVEQSLVKPIDITLEQWLDLKFGDRKKVDKEIVEGVVGTWLIRSYKKQFEEYMEIKRRLEVNEINTDVECDPTDIEFAKGCDDEEVLTYDDFSDLEEENLKFKDFNHLLQIDVEALTGDLPGFKTYADYKMRRSMNGTMKCHGLKKNHGWIMELERNLMMIYVMNASRLFLKVDMLNDPHWYEGLEDGDLKDEALIEKNTSSKDHGDMRIEKERIFTLEEESSDDAWINYFPNDDNDAIQANQERFDDHEPMEDDDDDDDDDIRDLDDYLIP